MENKFNICPRCKGTKIIDMGDSIDCPDCRLEFEKADIKALESNQILAVSEKLNFIRSIKKNNDKT
jgi:rubredoxin